MMMRRRCGSPRDPNCWKYGAVGISVCQRWQDSFAAFLEDMGPRPLNTSIDRIDNSKGYEPGNCRWVDARTQCRNRGVVILDEERVAVIRRKLLNGARHAELAKEYGVGRTMIGNIARGIAWKEVEPADA
jgi:hypothetical protein